MNIGGFDDGSSWIGVPSLAGDWEVDQGSPAGISGSESADEDSESESGDEGEDESEEEEEEEEVYEGDRTENVMTGQAATIGIEVDQVDSDGEHKEPSSQPL